MSKSTVVVAPSREQGRETIRTAGDRLKGARILTPRSTDALRGVTDIEKVLVADRMELTPDMITALALSVKSR